MSLIQVQDLTFRYDNNPQLIFDHASFALDTRWKLGLIGRNGRGKTTLLHLLDGSLPSGGAIQANVSFTYFPFPVADPQQPAGRLIKDTIAPFSRWEEEMQALLEDGSPASLDQYALVLEQYCQQDGYTIDEALCAEVGKLGVDAAVLDRPWQTLSGGEQVKCMLAGLFLKKNHFLLIDEPTNHLDADGRRRMAQYLKSKSGFILVSHDRAFLDEIVDHVLSINRSTIQVQRGNYSSWQQNKDQEDQAQLLQNQKLRQDIARLQEASRRAADWSEQVEARKCGTRNSGLRPDRGYLGHQSARLMARAKAFEARQEKAIQEKSQLLQDLEQSAPLKLHLLPPPKKRLLEVRDFTLLRDGQPLFAPVSFSVFAGDRVQLCGPNGCGKTSLLHALLGEELPFTLSGSLTRCPDLVCSTIPQQTHSLRGSFLDFAAAQGIDPTLFLTILRKLDLRREVFSSDLSQLSEGQKKKVLLSASLCRAAHLFIWDEPLNFIDLLSRRQMEQLVQEQQPTLLFVEHDALFSQMVATQTVRLSPAGDASSPSRIG